VRPELVPVCRAALDGGVEARGAAGALGACGAACASDAGRLDL